MLSILLLLFIQGANGAIITINSVCRTNQEFNSTKLGLYYWSSAAHTGGRDSDGKVWARDQYADQISTIKLSGGVLNVEGKVNCNASSDGADPANAESYIVVDFTIDSPFRFTNKTTSFQMKRVRYQPGQEDVTFVSLVDGLNHQILFFGYNGRTSDRTSGDASGILPPGEYKFTAASSLQCNPLVSVSSDPAARVSYTNHSSFSTLFSFSPVSAEQQQSVSNSPKPSVNSKPLASVNMKPFIFVAPMAIKQIQLKWDTNYVGYSLEETSDLTFTNWIPVTNSVSSIGQQYSVTVDASKANAFFRLHRN